MQKPGKLKIAKMDAPLRAKFRRALSVINAGGEDQWLRVMIARLIREAEVRYNLPLSVILKPEEKLIADVIENGAYDIRDIIAESHLTKADVVRILQQMIEAGFIERREKGGKTDQARGAVTYLYVIKSLPRASVDQSIV